MKTLYYTEVSKKYNKQGTAHKLWTRTKTDASLTKGLCALLSTAQAAVHLFIRGPEALKLSRVHYLTISVSVRQLIRNKIKYLVRTDTTGTLKQWHHSGINLISNKFKPMVLQTSSSHSRTKVWPVSTCSIDKKTHSKKPKKSHVSFQKLTIHQTTKIFKLPDLEVLYYEWRTTYRNDK